MPKGDHYTIKNINGRPEKVLDEADYRKKLIIVARTMGCLEDLLFLFDKYDRLLRTCRNDSEVEAIQVMGIKEISDLIDNGYMGYEGKLTLHQKTADGEEKNIILVDDYKSKKDAGII
jgi:hypothetical protein